MSQGYWGDQFTKTYKAAADLTACEFLAVRLSAAGQVNIASNNIGSASASVVGVLQNKPNTNQAASVAYFGESRARAGAAVTEGMWVTHDTSGFIINATSGTLVIGRANQAAAAAGDVISVTLQPVWRIGQL